MKNRHLLTICFILMWPFMLRSQSFFIDYIQKSPEVQNFDGYSFMASNNSGYDFSYLKDSLNLKAAIDVPINEFNEFVNNLLYPVRKVKQFPIILSITGDRAIDSIRITDVGLLDVTSEEKTSCASKIYVLAHKVSSGGTLEFLMLTDTQEGVYVEIYVYSLKEDRILSYVPLLSGEKLDAPKCPPFGINLVAAYQTVEISSDVITQQVNDGFSKPWVRKLRRNDDGYYELLWHDNPMRSSTTFKAVINDPDGYTNVRRLPNTNSTVLYTIKEGEIFTVEEYTETSSWLKIFDYSGQFEGWIHRSRVKKVVGD